jgi:hypothetical protein
VGEVTSEQALRAWAYKLVREENYELSVDEVVEDAGKIVDFILAKTPDAEPGTMILGEVSFEDRVHMAQGGPEDCPTCEEEARQKAPYRVWSARSERHPEDDTCVIREFSNGRGEFSSLYGGWISWEPSASAWTKYQEISISDLPVKLQPVK